MTVLDEMLDAAQEAPQEPIKACEAKIRTWAAAHPCSAQWGHGRNQVFWSIGIWGAENEFILDGDIFIRIRDGAVTVWGGAFHKGNVQVGAPWRDMHVRRLAASLDVSGL